MLPSYNLLTQNPKEPHNCVHQGTTGQSLTSHCDNHTQVFLGGAYQGLFSPVSTRKIEYNETYLGLVRSVVDETGPDQRRRFSV